MKKVMRVVGFEAKKFLLDKSRVIFFILAMAALVAILFGMMFFFFDGGYESGVTRNPYDQIMEQGYLDKIAELKEEYEACQKLNQDVCNQPLEIKRYEALIRYKVADWYRGYTLIPFYVKFELNEYTYQAYIYMFFPIIMALNAHSVFSSDESKGYSKNYSLLGLETKRVFIGKALYSAIALFVTFVGLNMFGLYFTNNVCILLFDGSNYHVITRSALYICRMFEMTIALTAIFLLFMVINLYVKNHILAFGLTLFLSFGFMPVILTMLAEYQDQYHWFIGTLHHYPFYNMLTSDGLLDGHALYRLGVPIACIVVLLVVIMRGDIISKVFKKMDRDYRNADGDTP